MSRPFFIDYLFELRWSICLSTILFLIFLWVLRPKKEIRILWIVFIIGLFTQIRFGTLHNGFFLHDHDCIHYQMGSKYFKEFGYNGMYAGLTQALKELNQTFPSIKAPKTFRDLDNKTGPHLNSDHPKAQKIKERFTDQRWQELKNDIISWDTKHSPNWEHIVKDAGYNPPPAWTVWGLTMNKIISPKQSVIYGLPDIIVLAIIFYLLWTTLGARATLYSFSTMLFFPGGPFAPFDWIGGSLFRFLWFLWLSIGLLCYYKKQYRMAGFALALGAMERVFPGAWLASAGLVSIFSLLTGYKSIGWKAIEPLKGLVVGGTIGISTVLIMSHLIVGIGAWGDFISHIKEHGSYLFTNHLGWTRAITFHPKMGEMGFNPENMSIFNDWNEILLQRKEWISYTLLRLVLMGSIIFWAYKCTMRGQEALAIAWMGSAIVFFLAMPAHYYLLGLLPILALTASQAPKMFLGVLISIALINAVTQMSETLGWALASIIIATSIAYGLGDSIAKKNNTKWALLSGGTAFFILFFLPNLYSDPIPSAIKSERDPLQTVKTIRRSSLIKEGYEVKDNGFILLPKDSLKIRTKTTNNHKLYIRTDRYFKGTLNIKTPEGQLLRAIAVEPRGNMFDTLEAGSIPEGRNFILEWDGEPGTDIAIFSVWTEPTNLRK